MRASLLSMLAVVFAIASQLGCVTRHRVVHHRVRPTCDAACDYYLACKGSESDTIYDACLGECQESFTDPDVLREFQRLECEDAVAFVEGPTGRPPGSAPRR